MASRVWEATPSFRFRTDLDLSTFLSIFFSEDHKMRYGIAWLLGVPVSVLVIVYLFTHLL